MDVEVFVHGVPCGADFWGKDDRERKFLGQFYNVNSGALKLVIQTRKLGNTCYTYYSYIVNKDVLDSDGRPGSYFGLTVRLDRYYKDFRRFFYFLDLVFQKYILGVVLERKVSGFQYKVHNFNDAKISALETVFTNLMLGLLKDDEVGKLKNVVNAKSNCAFNIYDASVAEVEKAVLNGSVVSLSPYFTSKATEQLKREYGERIQGLESDCSSIANENKTKILQLNNAHEQEMAEVKRQEENKVEELKNRVNQLESEKKSLQEHLAQHHSLLQPIYDTIKNSGEKNKGKDDKNSQGNKSSNRIKNFGEKNKGKDDNNSQGNKPSKGIDVLRIAKNIQPLLVLLCLLLLLFPRLNRDGNQQSEQNTSEQSGKDLSGGSPPQVSPMFEVVEIDENTKETIGQPVDSAKNGSWYMAKVIDGEGQDTREWCLEGATVGQTRNDDSLTFVANTPDTIRISCNSVNGLCFYKELPVKK